jgi:hypothetical protein
VPLLWWHGRLRLLLGRRHLLSAAVAAGVCVAWVAAAVSLTGWDIFSETVSREALQRLSPSHHLEAQQQLSADHQPKMYPWGEVLAHPFVVLAGNLPWSAFALVTLWPGFGRLWDERGRRLLQGLHCWVWPNLFFWSIIPEHAPRHSFPLYPGVAGLAVMVWVAFLTGRLRWRLPAVLTPARVLAGMLVGWLVIKVVFVEAVLPARNPNRGPRAKGEQLAALVPADQPLYVFQVKDEGIMFYYGRARPQGGATPPVLRLPTPDELPSTGEPMFCILDEPEWQRWRAAGRAEALVRLSDEQGTPIVLVRAVPGADGFAGLAGDLGR